MVCLTMSLHWVQKFPCNDGAWSGLEQYKYMCYTDVLALYYGEGLVRGRGAVQGLPGRVPGGHRRVHGAIGLPVNALGERAGAINEGQLFYNLNVLALGALAIATRGAADRRPAPTAVGHRDVRALPGLFLSATINWDLLAIGLTAAGWYFWARRQPALAGVFVGAGRVGEDVAGAVGLAVAGAVLAGPARCASFGTAAWAGAFTLALVNIPVAVLWPGSWARFFELNSERPVDWGTIWYIGSYFPLGNDRYGIGPFQWLGDNLPMQNAVSWVLILLAIGIAVLRCVRAPRRPRLAQMAFLVMAVFLIFNKVWSQQFVLWLIPLAVLARPRWGAFLSWQVAEIAYFAAFYGGLMGEAAEAGLPRVGVRVGVRASPDHAVRAVWLVIREILHPELDVVRQTYDDDPDGGVLDGAPDRDDWPGGWPPEELSGEDPTPLTVAAGNPEEEPDSPARP